MTVLSKKRHTSVEKVIRYSKRSGCIFTNVNGYYRNRESGYDDYLVLEVSRNELLLDTAYLLEWTLYPNSLCHR